MPLPRPALSPEQVKAELDAGRILVLDVREPEECEGWKIAGSVNLPLQTLPGALAALPKGRPIVTVCMHGARSAGASGYLASLGYNAHNMAGGMVEWNRVYDIAEVPTDAPGIKVLQFRRVGKGCLSYLAISNGQAVVIDATIDAGVYRKAAEGQNAAIIGCLDTHTHADHVSGGHQLAGLAGAKYYSPDKSISMAHEQVQPGLGIRFGAAQMKVLAAPGHTPESVVYRLGNLAFTGDTLFVESVGRPDLGQDAAANAAVLWETLQKLLRLPADTLILPCHYGDGVAIKTGVAVLAQLGKLKGTLQPLALGQQEFVAWVTAGERPKPANFEFIKDVNRGRAVMDDVHAVRELEAGPNRCAV